MNRIRLLSEQVANQIAAGEVVERPASVVKELVENSLDAEAERITVEIQAGGRALIRVTDDGLGMSRDDALLCLERHATSKIQRAEDLHSISTMGFRGEALPSIASVSRFTLTTRERESESPEGTQISINGGRIQDVRAAGCATGTTVEVRQIFFNLPARRKFLRAEETESAHIQHYLTVAALACPRVAFVFIKDGRTVWQLPSVGGPDDLDGRLAALRERHRSLAGGGPRMIAVHHTAKLPALTEADELRDAPAPDRDPDAIAVWGLIGAPGLSRSNRDDQHIFVNRRPVENRGLNFSLIEGYHTALMKGQYPVCCLFIEIDPAEVDVNIHPSKREVKFHRERTVRQIVAQAVRNALLDFHQSGTVPARPAAGLAPDPAMPKTSSDFGSAKLAPPPPFEMTSPPPPLPVPVTADLGLSFRKSPSAPPSVFPAQTSAAPGVSAPAPTAPVPMAGMSGIGSPLKPVPDPAPLLKVPLRIIGVVGRLYVLLESDRGLVLLDQHAAHERILFEQMLRRLESNEEAASQGLLLPETVEVGPRDAQFLRENLAALNRLGVGLSEFGENTFLLDSLPPFVKARDPRLFVLGVVDELKASGEGVNALRLGEHVVAKTVCRQAVKANDTLAREELEALVRDLRHCEMPYTCPHGRPTILEMSYRELEKKFGRIQ
jgi:DNA mismatch repair protein MutL